MIERERKGDYLGKTVQVVPHITDAIQDWIEDVAKVPVDGKPGSPDVCVIELGGTVGDIESSPFVEALRQADSESQGTKAHGAVFTIGFSLIKDIAQCYWCDLTGYRAVVEQMRNVHLLSS